MDKGNNTDTKRKMKILHLGNFKSGIDMYVRNSVALAGDDFEFVIVGGADDNSLPFKHKGKEVKTYSISMFRALSPKKDIKALIQAVKIIKKEKPDLVHCHSAKGGVIGRIAARLTGTKSVYTAHAFSFLSSESRKKAKIYLLLEKIARMKSTLLACSESERKLGVDVVGYKEDRALVWSNAVPDSKPQVAESLNPAEDIHIPAPGEKYIVTIGRPSYQKNPLFMVDVAKGIHKKYPEIKFYLLGAGFYSPMLDEMKSLIHEYGLDDVFYILPWLCHAETLRFVEGSMLYFSTSLYEGLPIAVIEAMSLGKAVIASNVLGNKDCIKDGYNGMLLPLDDGIFVDKMCELIEKESLREEMGSNSRKYFESDFLIDNRIKALEDIYRNIISSK